MGQTLGCSEQEEKGQMLLGLDILCWTQVVLHVMGVAWCGEGDRPRALIFMASMPCVQERKKERVPSIPGPDQQSTYTA